MLDPNFNPLQQQPSAVPLSAPISLDTSSEDDTPKIDLDTGNQSTQVDQKYVDNRAFKAAYGLEGTSAALPQQDIKDNMSAGKEDDVRQQVTAQLNQEQDGKKQAAVTDAISNGASNDEVMKMLNYNTSFDPRTVFEVNFGNVYGKSIDQYSKELDGYNPWNIIKQFGDDEAIKQFGTRGIAYHDYILHRLQGIQSVIDKQYKDNFWGGYVPDFVAESFPFLNPIPEIHGRGNIPGVNKFDSLLGANLEEQRNKLFDMPFKEGVGAFDRGIDALMDKNPQAAASFAASMLGQSGLEKLMNNLNTVGTAFDAAAVVKLGALPFKAASVIAAGRRAMVDAYIAKGMNLDQTKAGILAAAGNVKGAAIEDVATTIEQRAKMAPDPVKDALEQLPRYLNVEKANIEKDPGNLSQNSVTELQQGYDAMTATSLEKLATILRPTRIPTEDLTRPQLKAIQDTVLERSPGLSNDLVHISDPYHDPISQTMHVDLHVGMYGSEEEALNKAREHGIAVKLSDDQAANLQVRIDDLKAQVKDSADMHADTAGLNHHFNLERQLTDLQQQLKDGTKNPVGAKMVAKEVTTPANPNTLDRIAEIKAELKDVRMDEDTAGMNRAASLEDELKVLESNPASVQQQGIGYYIKLSKTVDEEHPTLRSLTYTPEREASLTPTHGAADFLSILRNPDDTMSLDARRIRKATIYPQSLLNEIAHAEWQNIKKIGGLKNKIFNRSEYKNFKQALIDGQSDEALNFESPGKLQDYWMRRFGYDPSFAQQQAYFAVRRWNEYDRILREVSVYKYKARRGAETHEISLKDSNGDVISTAKFDGVQHRNFPGSSGGNILIVGNDPAGSKVRSLSKIHRSRKDVEELQDMLNSGQYKLIQPWDNRQRPFADFAKAGVENSDKTVDYVLTKAGNIQTSPLTWDQVPRRFGGHHIYDYSHYLKQSVIRNETVDGIARQRYLGDQTIMAIRSRRAGQDLADKMNEVMDAYRTGNKSRAEALTAKHLPFSWEDMVKKIETGQLDPHQPFHVVPRSMSVRDVDPALRDRIRDETKFIDDTRHGLAQNYEVQYTGPRDAPENFREVSNTGWTQNNPVFNYLPAQKVDPFQTMNRGLGQIIRSTFLDDYKLAAVQSYLEEAKPNLKLAARAQTEYSPYAAFNGLSRGDFEKSVPAETVNRLLGNKFKIDNLLGVPSTLDTFLHRFAQMSHDTVYGISPKAANKLVPAWFLSKTRDPFAFIRGITFDAYLGMFYPAQLFVQMASFVNIWALRPKYAAQSTVAGLLHGYAGLNGSSEILTALDKAASKLGWKPGQWLEGREALARTGFGNVAGEYGPLSGLKFAEPVSMGTDKFLNWGRKPFQWGERNVRIGAWYTAFKEFRDANPVGAITRQDLAKILENADLYYGNMSSASNSVLHTGILSLPTQFYSYTLRLAEIFWSKRIGETLAQRTLTRARLLGANAAMFGVPMSFGISGLPVAEYLRKQMLENGFLGQTEPYTVNDAQQSGKTGDWIEHMLMEGMPATMLTLITGNNYNLGPRYGTGGFDSIRRNLEGDAPFLGLLGASGTLAQTFWKDREGLWQAMSAIVNKDTKSFPVTGEDLVDLLRSIQTIGKGDQLIGALNSGHYLSRNSGFIKNVNPIDAFGMFLTGLSPQEQGDSYLRMQSLKDQTEKDRRGVQLITKEISRAWNSASTNDMEQAGKYLTRAIGWGIIYNLSDAKMAQALGQANGTAGTSLMQNLDYNRLIKNAPKGQEEQYMKAYGRIYQQMNQSGNQ